MPQNPFSNLTKTQLTIFLVTIFLVVALAIPTIKNWFGSPVKNPLYEEYEPWDPDNTENIKDKIAQLNKEGIELNAQKDMLEDYKNLLNAGYSVLNNTTADNNIKASLIAIQPLNIINYDKAYYTSNYKEMQDRLYSNIATLCNSYEAAYRDMVDKLGLIVSSITSSTLMSTSLADYNLIPKKQSPLITTADSIEAYVNTVNPGVSKERIDIFNTGKQKLITADTSLRGFINTRLNENSKRTNDLATELDKAKESYSKNKLDINKYAVLIGIPLFIAAALLMYVYGIRSSKKLKDELNAQNNFNSADYKTGLSFTLYTITSLILILSLLILGLAKVIADNTLAALLGTIAGYLLNNATDRSASSNIPPTPPTPPPAPGNNTPPPIPPGK